MRKQQFLYALAVCALDRYQMKAAIVPVCNQQLILIDAEIVEFCMSWLQFFTKFFVRRVTGLATSTLLRMGYDMEQGYKMVQHGCPCATST